MKDGQGLKTDK
jgi:DnaJ family protein C protein 27